MPLLATDAYGNFIRRRPRAARSSSSLDQRTAGGTQGLIEGNIAAPIDHRRPSDGVGYKAVRTGMPFIDDKAHTADPFDHRPATCCRRCRHDAGRPTRARQPASYDNELLDAHYVAGDGRVNENIGLTAVQDLFHAEHDRLVAQIKATVQARARQRRRLVRRSTGCCRACDLAILPSRTRVIQANEWNGERLFQAAKFGTETEYQHIVFEEFARYVAPAIHLAGGVNVHIDPAITSEFANVVYRFGHSMLDENIPLYQLGADGKPVIDPPTGQPQMTAGRPDRRPSPTRWQFASDPNMTADIVLGTVNQVSNSIDEFVTGSLQNNLLGLPLDLAALNIARGRDTGVAPLNLVRNQLFSRDPGQPSSSRTRAGTTSAPVPEARRVAGQLHRRLRHARQHHRRDHAGRQASGGAGAGRPTGRSAAQPSTSMPTTS